MGAVALGAVLFAVFLLIVAAMVWQEAKASADSEPVYVLDEVVPFVYSRLSEEGAAHLDDDDVMRILEWEVLYLQGLPRNGEIAGPGPVAGSVEALRFIVDRSRSEGIEYREEDVAEVLALEVAYLVDIGVVGPQADEGSFR